jgi:hypothetical protein
VQHAHEASHGPLNIDPERYSTPQKRVKQHLPQLRHTAYKDYFSVLTPSDSLKPHADDIHYHLCVSTFITTPTKHIQQNSG